MYNKIEYLYTVIALAERNAFFLLKVSEEPIFYFQLCNLE